MAANESRRRTDPLSEVSKVISEKTEQFQYQPLDPSCDCTRFVKIEPADNAEDPIECTLVHMAFGERPKFEALSYMWGDENSESWIFLHGVKVHVRQNLRDALEHLRKRAHESLFWIDALCIDQLNIAERTRQLPLIRHIYFRATTVVVWLGKKYLKFQEQLSKLRYGLAKGSLDADSDLTTAQDTDQESDRTVASRERAMVWELKDDGYWNRLWIMQEIGRAQNKRVSFGGLDMTWDAFVHLMTIHGVKGVEGPLKLASWLKDKYNGALAFRRLLDDHQHTECSEPRDTVYGLVGLAIDISGFPVDYNKSLMEVWTDTMEFMNGNRMFRESERECDIIYFGSLLKSRLMAKQPAPLQQLLHPYKVMEDSHIIIQNAFTSTNPKAFPLKAYILGSIGIVGPSTTEIVASSNAVQQWEANLITGLKNDISSASIESDYLIWSILDSEPDNLASHCSSHVSCVTSVSHQGYKKSLPYYKKSSNRLNDRDVDNTEQQKMTTTSNSVDHTYLYQIHYNYRSSIRWKTGITSAQARPGDLICWVKGTKRAMVVRCSHRLNNEYTSQIFGTAMTTEDLFSPDVDHVARLSWIQKGDENVIDKLHIDAATVFSVLP